jgi:uncharacterized membrane protein YjjP (DUF1212 family)
MLLRREPALWLGFIAIVVKVVSAFGFNVSADQQAWINAVAAALVGLILAVVAGDAISAAVLGFIQAALALAVGFGLDWSADQQAIVLSFAAAAVAMFDRTQITAPAPASAVKQPTVVA